MTTPPSAVDLTGSESTNNSDINNNIKELLSELREQRQDINSLKDEVRENSLSVNSDVKRLKTVHELKWRSEGNKIQYEFNSDLREQLKQVLWAIENRKTDYAREILKDNCQSLKRRNKLLRIADSSEGGWETVRQYEANPVASDSDDESKINRAESRALRKKKALQNARKRPKPSATVGSGSYNQRTFGPAVPLSFQPQPYQQHGSFRPFRYGNTSRTVLGPCFACGENTHLRRNCPYYKNTAYVAPRPDTPARK